MRFLKQSSGSDIKISLILLDWSVRESFHLLHYLSEQTLPRHQFEVIIVEYYATISSAIEKFAAQVDSWVLLEMPPDSYYHKHLMYNVGIAVAKGEIVIICDSDAMAKPTFLQSVITEFAKNPNIILHIDQFRNNRKDLYPFCYPSFEEVIGAGCINNVNGKTKGVLPTQDPLHERNYGACFCAKRADLIKIGGADEHIDFIGHICGPYDLTFRLLNLHKTEVWHQEEFLYHTWHPGQAGVDNYLGPHDGRHMSTTSLEAISSGRIMPHVTNLAINYLAEHNLQIALADLIQLAISQANLEITKRSFLESVKAKKWSEHTRAYLSYGGYIIIKNNDVYTATPIINYPDNAKMCTLLATTLPKIKAKIFVKHNLANAPLLGLGFSLYFLGSVKSVLLRHSKRVASNMNPLSTNTDNSPLSAEFLTRSLTKIKSMVMESRVKTQELMRLLLNLKILNDTTQKTTIVFTHARTNMVLLSLYIFNKKNIQLKKIQTQEQLSSCLQQLAYEANLAKIVVPNDFYLQYKLILTASKQHNLVIL